MTITRQTVAGKLTDYLKHRLTLNQIVDWAENALQNGELDDDRVEVLARVIARLGVADVRAFGLTWQDCEDLLGQLGYAARVEVVQA